MASYKIMLKRHQFFLGIPNNSLYYEIYCHRMCQILFGVRWLTWSDSNHVWSFLSHLKQLSTSSYNSGLKSKKENSFLKFWLFGGVRVGLKFSFVIDEPGFDLVQSLGFFFALF